MSKIREGQKEESNAFKKPIGVPGKRRVVCARDKEKG